MKEPLDISQEEFEQIEAYINQSLSETDTVQFELRLRNEPGLSEKVAEIRDTIIAIESSILSEKMEGYHKNLSAEKAERNHRNYRPFAYAVAAILIVAIGVLWMMNQGSDHERLFASHFTPDPGLPTTMSTTNDYAFYEAMVDYKRKAYASAIAKWEPLYEAKPNNDTLAYFLGVAELANNNETKAITYLTQSESFDNSIFEEEAHYYLGMAYLKAGDIPLARKHLSLSATEKAKKVLAQL